MIKHIIAIAVVASLLAIFTVQPSNSAAPDATEIAPAPVEDSMHEFMEYVYQPTYKRLKVSMAQAPADRAGWKAVKADALTLAEAANLLLIRVPEKNGKEWAQHADATRTHGAALYKAARAQDYAAAQKSYATMLQHCNACHKTFADGKYQLKP